MQVPEFRLQSLECFSHNNVPLLTARAFDCAAATYALCRDEYCAFLRECLDAWRDDPTATPQQLLRRAGQPLSLDMSQVSQMSQASQVSQAYQSDTLQTPETPHPNMNQIALQERLTARLLARPDSMLCKRCHSRMYACVSDNPQRRSADEGGSAVRKCTNPDCGVNTSAANEKI